MEVRASPCPPTSPDQESLTGSSAPRRDYARAAASDNTLKAYAKDWAHFARWCRMKGAEPLPLAFELIGLYPDTIRSEIEEPTEDRNPLRTGFEISRCKSPFYEAAHL